MPLLALQTSLTVDGRLAEGHRAQGGAEPDQGVAHPQGQLGADQREDTMSHLDPLTARPELNPLVAEMGDFLGPAR